MVARTPFVNIIHGPHRRPLVKAVGHENVVHPGVRLSRPPASPAIGRRDERRSTLYRHHPSHRNRADFADLELIFPSV